ncbi:uncharacterized protein LOC144619239 [Crassostrea virginica]
MTGKPHRPAGTLPPAPTSRGKATTWHGLFRCICICILVFLYVCISWFSCITGFGLKNIACLPGYHYCDGTLYCCPSGYICSGTSTCLHLALIICPIVGLVLIIACTAVCCSRRRSTPGVVYSPTPKEQM